MPFAVCHVLVNLKCFFTFSSFLCTRRMCLAILLLIILPQNVQKWHFSYTCLHPSDIIIIIIIIVLTSVFPRLHGLDGFPKCHLPKERILRIFLFQLQLPHVICHTYVSRPTWSHRPTTRFTHWQCWQYRFRMPAVKQLTGLHSLPSPAPSYMRTTYSAVTSLKLNN